MSVVYLDSSALVRLVVREPETAALCKWLRGRAPLVSSALACVEVTRAVLDQGALATDVLGACELIAVTDAVVEAASVLPVTGLSTSTAIHLATARLLAHDVDAVVAYDRRFLETCGQLEMATASPGQRAVSARDARSGCHRS